MIDIPATLYELNEVTKSVAVSNVVCFVFAVAMIVKVARHSVVLYNLCNQFYRIRIVNLLLPVFKVGNITSSTGLTVMS